MSQSEDHISEEPVEGTGPEDGPALPSATEEGPTAPGWLEPEVDRAFAMLPLPAARVSQYRNSYLDCLASPARGRDLDDAHDSCRIGLLQAMKAGFACPDATWRAFEKKLEAIEAELTSEL